MDSCRDTPRASHVSSHVWIAKLFQATLLTFAFGTKRVVSTGSSGFGSASPAGPATTVPDYVSIAVTGDFNLNPNLTWQLPGEFAAPWGSFLPVARSFDLLLLNHESTLAHEPDPHPNNFRYEDPANFTETFHAAEVAWVGQANNHQFDFWGRGVQETMQTLRARHLAFGGLGSPAAVQAPTMLIPATCGASKGVPAGPPLKVAVFALVAQLCHKHENGTAILTSCTCGLPFGEPDMPPRQCYAANRTHPGLWYLPFPSTPAEVAAVVGTVAEYVASGAADLVVTYLHAGPNFEWHPQPDREALLRRLSEAGSDIVWGTSSHHVQRMELHRGRPIIYGLGDLLFRFVPGVDYLGACEQGMSPCEQFRPDLSLVYEFQVQAKCSAGEAQEDRRKVQQEAVPVLTLQRPEPHLPPRILRIRAHPTKHNATQIQCVSDDEVRWLMNTFNELSNSYGLNMVQSEDGSLWVEPQHDLQFS